MAIKLKYVAQACLDDYYQNYKTPTDFFDLNDFIYRCGAAATDFYNKLYREQYALMRADGETGEAVSFSDDFLATQELKVETKDGEVFAKLEKQVMSFVYDQSNVGISNVFRLKPSPVEEIERSDIDEFWQLKYLPTTCRIFWALDGEKVRLFNNTKNNVKEIRVLYVPSINGTDGDVELPDGIVQPVTMAVMTNMRNYAGKPIKTSLDNNPNTTLQSEANPNTKAMAR